LLSKDLNIEKIDNQTNYFYYSNNKNYKENILNVVNEILG